VIRYDRSPHSVVVWCTCGWREVSVTSDGARRVARAHEVGLHPDRFQVRDAEKRRAQRAQDPGCSGSGGTMDE
jgi:hypothetical protein